MNGSNTILLPKDGRNRSNAKVSVLQLLEPGICLVQSTLRRRPDVIQSPTSRSNRGDDSAEQHVHRPAAKGSIRSAPANKSIGFISCPENMRLDTDEGLQQLKDAVVDLINLGSDFISVACAKKKVV